MTNKSKLPQDGAQVFPYMGWLAIMWPSQRVTWQPITPYKDIIIHTIKPFMTSLQWKYIQRFEIFLKNSHTFKWGVFEFFLLFFLHLRVELQTHSICKKKYFSIGLYKIFQHFKGKRCRELTTVTNMLRSDWYNIHSSSPARLATPEVADRPCWNSVESTYWTF